MRIKPFAAIDLLLAGERWCSWRRGQGARMCAVLT